MRSALRGHRPPALRQAVDPRNALATVLLIGRPARRGPRALRHNLAEPVPRTPRPLPAPRRGRAAIIRAARPPRRFRARPRAPGAGARSLLASRGDRPLGPIAALQRGLPSAARLAWLRTLPPLAAATCGAVGIAFARPRAAGSRSRARAGAAEIRSAVRLARQSARQAVAAGAGAPARIGATRSRIAGRRASKRYRPRRPSPGRRGSGARASPARPAQAADDEDLCRGFLPARATGQRRPLDEAD
jgi:hypothetical protein